MFSFIKTIADILLTVLDMVINIILMFFEIVLIIPKALLYIFTAVGFLPAFCGAVVLVGVGVSVALFFINHGGD